MKMHTLYSIVSGPLVWVAVAVLVLGLTGRFFSLVILARKRDPMVYKYLSFKYSLRSIARWNTPYATRNMRLHPVVTAVSFLFHISLFAAPLFLLAHVVLFEEGIGFGYWTLPNQVADGLTVAVMAGLVFFGVRRVYAPEVRYVTSFKEHLLLLAILAPFLTGFLAYHQIGPYQPMLIAHMITGEILLMIIPFTWLSHMILGFMIRAYMGSEFGGVRHARDW